jgi:hypothetical protein
LDNEKANVKELKDMVTSGEEAFANLNEADAASRVLVLKADKESMDAEITNQNGLKTFEEAQITKY